MNNNNKYDFSNHKVQILLVFYNGSKFFSEQFDSLRNQTHKNIEILILNNGSNKDETIFLMNLTKNYINVTIYESSNNIGPFKGFEYLIDKVTSDYFAFCDQDDIWEAEKVELMLSYLIQNNLLLCYSDLYVADQDCKIIKNSMWKDMNTPPLAKNSSLSILIKNPITGCATLCSSEIIEHSVPFVEGVPHDWIVGIVASCKNRLGFISERTIRYRHHGANHAGGINFSLSGLRKNIKRRNSLDNYLNVRNVRRLALLKIIFDLKRSDSLTKDKIFSKFIYFYLSSGNILRFVLSIFYFIALLISANKIGFKNIIIDCLLNLIPRSQKGYDTKYLTWK